MKNWLLYFFAVMIMVVSVPIAADKAFAIPKVPTISVSLGGEIKEISAEEFAVRILLAESENAKSFETKKALAVSARSIALYLSVFGCKHEDFDVCDDVNCCFYLGDIENANKELLDECANAVQETFGIALTVDDIPAMALFTLCSGSGTGNCAEFTYLTAVGESKKCETHITEAEHEFSLLADLLFENTNAEKIKENSVIVYGENQKCNFAVLDGVYLKAQDIKNALSLGSNEFTLTFAEDSIKSAVYGVGHGYGLSLCGAEKMATAGSNFEEILKNYYSNLLLNKMYHN